MMMRALSAVTGALFAGLAATAASAAPIGPSVADRGLAEAGSGIVLAHGIHRTCQWDKWGYHRSYPWGRSACAQPRVSTLPLALWAWRCADGHCGYWHRSEHRWRDGWKNKGDYKYQYRRKY